MGQQTKTHGNIALAVQGAFGHKYYAMGILQAFRDKGMEFCAGSSSVEMMEPVLLYFSDQLDTQESTEEFTHIFPEFFKLTICPDVFGHLERWSSKSIQAYNSWLLATVNRVWRTNCSISDLQRSGAEAVDAANEAVANSIPGGILSFSSRHKQEVGAFLERVIPKLKRPVFTNAMNAESFREIYLYAGQIDDECRKRLPGSNSQRDVYPLTTEFFFASGARPPYFEPAEVTVEGKTQLWMEGAMRCNPPLNPLIDVDADRILLLRFFCKEKKIVSPQSSAESQDRYLETIFTAPLEKEIELINARSRGLQEPGKRHITIIDPTDSSNPHYYVEDFDDLVARKLSFSSHFRAQWPLQRESMYEDGKWIGKQIANRL